MREKRGIDLRRVCAKGAIAAAIALPVGEGIAVVDDASHVMPPPVTAAAPTQASNATTVGARGRDPVNTEQHGLQPGRMITRGGPVQHDPVIYSIFWGKNWKHDTLHMRHAVNSTYRSLRGSWWNKGLTRYTDSTGHVNDDVKLGGTWTDFSRNNGHDEQEIRKVIALNHWEMGPNSQFVVIYQPGHSPGPCGFHSVLANALSSTYTVALNQSDGSCHPSLGDTSLTDALTVTITHEYAESVTDPLVTTDPLLNAWLNPDDWETADLCQRKPGVEVRGHLYARYWNLKTNRCNGTGLGE